MEVHQPRPLGRHFDRRSMVMLAPTADAVVEISRSHRDLLPIDAVGRGAGSSAEGGQSNA
jgi:hypothetical protein